MSNPLIVKHLLSRPIGYPWSTPPGFWDSGEWIALVQCLSDFIYAKHPTSDHEDRLVSMLTRHLNLLECGLYLPEMEPPFHYK